jgi:O-antigen/teichoic acid export membrane protein
MSSKQHAVFEWAERKAGFAERLLDSRQSRGLVLSGSVIMLVGSGFVSLANFGYNISVAHLLGPGDFSHAAAAVTLLMLASCINLAFQLVAAKFIARNQQAGGRAAVYRTLMRQAWSVGLGLCVALLLLSEPISHYLRLPSKRLIEVLALGMLFYIPLGVRRGGMQGTCQFVRLSVNLIVEALVKLIAAVAFVLMGAGVMGAVGSISLSVFAAYLLPAGDAALRGKTGPGQVASFSEGVQAIIFFIGQVIISNIDILMVKHYFAPRDAGLYAAIALVGRLLYFATWSVTSAMFPVSAGQAVERESRKTVAVPLLFVSALSVGFVLLLAAFPDLVIGTLFGSGFHHGGMKLLLTMNAIATGTYALSVVLMTYEMSRRIANTGWLQLVVSGLVVAGVAVFHASLLEVIVVQQILRILLLFAVSVPFFVRGKASVQEAA